MGLLKHISTNILLQPSHNTNDVRACNSFL